VDIGEKDAAQNVTRGDVHLSDASGCYIWGDSRLVGSARRQGLDHRRDRRCILVAERSRVEEVKQIVERLDSQARSEHVSIHAVYRPWGYYETIDAGERFQVKRIMVKPGKHFHCRCTTSARSTGSSFSGPRARDA